MKHTIITGTGRAGTTFLMKLFTILKLDTGFDIENADDDIDDISFGGLEIDIRNQSAPYFIKGPLFMDYAEEVFNNKDIEIENIIIPIRNLKDAAQSRIFVSEKIGITGRGGLWGTTQSVNQEVVLTEKLLKFLILASRYNIPIMFIHFPTLILDKEYLYEKLKHLVHASKEEFNNAFALAINPDLIKKYYDK